MTNYPHAPGFKDATTSREAAEALEQSGRAMTLREKVENYFISGRTGTSDEVAEWLREGPLSIRPRLSELYRLGRIERTGERRKSSEGKPSHVYRRKATA